VTTNKKPIEGTLVEPNDVEELVGEVERAQIADKGKWLSLSKAPRSQNAYQRKINELEQQVKILANRPNIFELDDAEVMAIAGEDAAMLIRAAKSKAHSVLGDAERSAQSLRDQAARELNKTKREIADLLKAAKGEAEKILSATVKESESIKQESARVLMQAKQEAERISKEADLRAKELLDRAVADAKEEARRIITEINNERKRFVERLEIQKDQAQKASLQAAKVKRELINASNAIKSTIDQALVDWSETEQKSENVVNKMNKAQEGINS